MANSVWEELEVVLTEYESTQPAEKCYRSTWGYVVGYIAGYSETQKSAAIVALRRAMDAAKAFEATQGCEGGSRLRSADTYRSQLGPDITLDPKTMRVLTNGTLKTKLSEFISANSDKLTLVPDLRFLNRQTQAQTTSHLAKDTDSSDNEGSAPPSQRTSCLGSFARLFCCCFSRPVVTPGSSPVRSPVPSLDNNA